MSEGSLGLRSEAYPSYDRPTSVDQYPTRLLSSHTTPPPSRQFYFDYIHFFSRCSHSFQSHSPNNVTTVTLRQYKLYLRDVNRHPTENKTTDRYTRAGTLQFGT